MATVENLDPDTGVVMATAVNVTVLESIATGSEQAVGEGGVGFDSKSFWLVAADVGFTVNNRDRITDDAGTKWLVQDVTTEAFGAVYVCRDCVKQR